jgi:ATP adenylyltransferase
MSLKQDVLYAPWRKEYIASNTRKDSKDSKKCVFCKPLKEEVIFETKRVFLQANKYPYGEGHLLVIPKRHVNQIIDLTTKEREELFNLMDLGVYSLTLLMKPQGFNIGCSIGDVAGESINHLHFHVLPRYKGDVSWSRLCDFQLVSISPIELTEKLKTIIIENKLVKKFNL